MEDLLSLFGEFEDSREESSGCHGYLQQLLNLLEIMETSGTQRRER